MCLLQIDSYLTSSVRRHLPTGARPGGWCSRFARVLSRSWCLACCKMYGNYLTCCYLCMKLLYLANGIGQLWLLDVFLGFQRSYQLYGFHVLVKFLRGEDWSQSERFPRVTLCDFQVSTSMSPFTSPPCIVTCMGRWDTLILLYLIYY